MENSSAANDRIDDITARFSHLCKSHFALDEKRYADALKLFKQSKNVFMSSTSAIRSNAPEELEKYLFAFVLYIVKRLNEKNPSGAIDSTNQIGLTLCQILRAVKLNLVDFFKELPQLVVRTGPIISAIYGKEWEKKLQAKELQANFVHLSCLSNHYKRAYQEFFKTNEADLKPLLASSDPLGHTSDYSRFGWLLFLALRVHVFSSYRDLVTCIHGLVSILAILIIHIPARLRNSNVLDSPPFEKTDKGVYLVASLCKKYDTAEDDVKRMMDKANDLISDILKKKPQPASESDSENLVKINSDGLLFFKDLLEDSSLPNYISMLEKDYADADWNKSDIDERLFINDDDSLLGSGSLSGGAVCISGTKRKFDATASPTKTITSPLSPCRSPAQQSSGQSGASTSRAPTPVSTAMTTLKWLRTVIFPLPSHPSAQLDKYFASCDRNVSSEITRRAHIILAAIFPNIVLGERCASEDLLRSPLMESIWTQQRQQEVLKLYYRVLEAMCTAEAQMLNANNLTSLLTNERFHRCMLACSAELVLATHKAVTMLFPFVLEKTGITAFDLSKVIESFIRHEESLPRELRRHLNSLEERLLESMVWQKGSSMFNSLIIARPTLSTEIIRLGLLADPMPSLDSIAVDYNISTGGLPPLPFLQKPDTAEEQNGEIRSPKRAATEYRSVLVERNSFGSPMKDRLINNLKQKLTPPALQSAFASPSRPNPGGRGETCAETGINIFFSKIVKLAAVRINNLVEKLREKLGGVDLLQQFRESVYILFQKILNQRTSLFFNRHIDQIILCCFYGVAKITHVKLEFKDIIFHYRKQPLCKPVFRSVFVDWSSAPKSGRQGQSHVDIITFYNEIFIPSVKPLLVELGPLGTGIKEEPVPEKNDNKEVQCPGSPRVSAFPSLPDMSPKKVLTGHNVYVSPLRSSKMDMTSNGSRSYYARVGESSRDFQSPSKDLTAINDRLNSPPCRIKGPLNFKTDASLVSDSVVANSLCLQDAQPIKTEQSDS